MAWPFGDFGYVLAIFAAGLLLAGGWRYSLQGR